MQEIQKTMSTCNVPNRTLFCDDNLEVLQGMNSQSIDLICLDPPFNKNKNFTAPIGTRSEGAGFSDIFRKKDVKDEWLITIEQDQPDLYQYLNGIKGVGKPCSFAYLACMAIRLIECQRVLKPTGSIYLHCNPTMSHYLKTTMDCVFGEENYMNEIIWQRYGSHNDAKRYGSVTDSIFYYAGIDATWKAPRIPLTDEDIAKRYIYEDERGRYTTSPLHARTLSGGGCAYTWKGLKDVWKFPEKRLNELEKNNQIHWPKKGRVPRRKVHLTQNSGRPLSNLWTDIGIASGNERTGYPTQKPLALLERIIQASSSENDIVFDPFCGCATTCVAAERLDRQWIGIDISVRAYELVKERLMKEAADPEDIFKYKNEIYMRADPPVRTDLSKDYREKKYVYILSHPSYPGEYKVGIAKNWQSRLNACQTSDPDRQYKIEYKLQTPHFRQCEAYIHRIFPNKHEWVRGDLKRIISEIKNYTPAEPQDEFTLASTQGDYGTGN